MEIAFEAVDLERIRRFWSVVPGNAPRTISLAAKPAMRLVTRPLSGTAQELAETLTALGGRVLSEEDGWVLMADPEGNEFYIRPSDDD
jgi:hypothetical protein